MAKFEDEIAEIYAKDRTEWRAWLIANHATSPGVWLIFYKKNSNKPSVTYDEVVEECLCFGWIDSKVQGIDQDRYRQMMTPRKPNSPWSKSNKKRLEKLFEQGLMMPAGIEKVEAAKEDGSWTILDAVEELIVPADLQTALDENPKAREHFSAFNDSTKKGILWWIISAKRATTREKRIRETVEKAARNEKAK